MEQAFCDAYNAADLSAMAALLAPEATTELVGADVAPEVGPEAIRAGSFTHILGDGDLRATPLDLPEGRLVAFHAADGALDSLAAFTTDAGLVSAIRYHTQWHDAAFVKQIAGR